MKKPFVFFVWGIFFILLQTSLFSRLFPLIPRPNLVLIILVCLSTSSDSWWTPVWVAIMGLFFDVLSGGPIGLFCLIFLVIHVIIKGVGRVVLLGHPVFQAGAVLFAHLLQALLLFTILALLGLPFPGDPSQANQILFSSIVGSLISLPFFVLFERIGYPPALPLVG
jgi:rod shape-determining protein MreD